MKPESKKLLEDFIEPFILWAPKTGDDFPEEFRD